jgi:hypothetical protein
MPSELANRVMVLGWLEIDRSRVDEVFPPKEGGPAQQEQIEEWCRLHGFRHEWCAATDRLRVVR